MTAAEFKITAEFEANHNFRRVGTPVIEQIDDETYVITAKESTGPMSIACRVKLTPEGRRDHDVRYYVVDTETGEMVKFDSLPGLSDDLAGAYWRKGGTSVDLILDIRDALTGKPHPLAPRS